MPYKAFISYSHAADGQLAPALQSGLQGIAKPFYRLRALRIFRDETSLHLTPKLWPMIQQALGESEHFILMASPAAARSKWVQNEVDERLRLQNDMPEKVHIVLTEGEIVWDNSANDFDWGKTTALPENLRGRFTTEPLYLDFRWARESEHLSLRNPQFLRAIGKLAAAIHDKPLDTIIGEDVRQHRIFKWATGAVMVLLSGLLMAASSAAYYANERKKEANRAAEKEKAARDEEKEQRKQAEAARNNERVAKDQVEERRQEAEKRRREAEQQRERAEQATENERAARGQAEERRREAERQHQTALARQLAAQSQMLPLNTDDNLIISFLLALESMHRVQTFEGAQALRRTLHSATVNLDQENEVEALAFSPGGKSLVTATEDGQIFRWDIATGSKTRISINGQPIEDAPKVQAWAFDSEGTHLATADTYGRTRLFNAITGNIRTLLYRADVETVAFSGDGKRLATGSSDKTARVWDVDSGAEVTRIPHRGDVLVVALSRDGKWLATASVGNVVRVFQVDGGREMYSLPQSVIVRSMVISPDGKYLATAGHYTTQLWNRADGQKVDEIKYGEFAEALAFSDDSKWLATGFHSGAGVWDVTTRRELARIEHKTGTGVYLAFSHDKEYLATWGNNKVVKLSVLSPENLFKAAVQHKQQDMRYRNLTLKEWRQYAGDEPPPTGIAKGTP